jgi:hypothetical protein
LLALDHDDADRHPSDDAIPDREILRGRMAADRELADDGAAFQHLLIEFLVFFRVADVYSRAENPDGAAADGRCALMSDSIHAAGQAANDG